MCHNILYLVWLHPFYKPVGSPGKVSSAPMCVLLQQVAQPQNTRWNIFTCHCQSTSQVSQTDNHPESHVTTHLLLILNVYLETLIWRNACLFAKTAKRYCSRREQISKDLAIVFWNWREESGTMQHLFAKGLRHALIQPVIVQGRSLLLHLVVVVMMMMISWLRKFRMPDEFPLS